MIRIAAEEEAGKGGGGPEDDPRTGVVALRSEGFLTLAFGLALGVALAFLFWLLCKFPPNDTPPSFILQFQPWHAFLAGFIGGTITAGIYNLLVVRRVNLFGLESSMD